MLRLLLTLMRHRVTYRFLLVLTAALGATALSGDIDQLETLVCTLLACTD